MFITLKILFFCFFVLPVLAYSFNFFSSNRLTTLDQWQQAVHVAVVEVKRVVRFPLSSGAGAGLSPVLEVKIIDMLTQEKPKQNTIYTMYHPLQAGQRAILSLGLFVTTDENQLFFAYSSISAIEREINKRVIYAHGWHQPWLLEKNEQGFDYLPDCVDGLTKMPIHNPLVEDLKKLSHGLVDKEPQLEVLGFLWPSGLASLLPVKRCSTKKFNPPRS